MPRGRIQPDRAKCGMVRNGKTCGRTAGYGTDHLGIGRCKYHLGTTRNHRLAADKEKARRAAELLGVPIVTDSFTALQDALDAANGMKQAVEQMLRESAAGESEVKVTTALVFYADAIDRLAKVAKTYADANIDERRAALDESLKRQYADMLDAAFRLYLERMDYTPERATEARKVFAGAFRELTPKLVGAS